MVVPDVMKQRQNLRLESIPAVDALKAKEQRLAEVRGIVDCADNALCPEFYSFVNRWDGQVGAAPVTAFAGSFRTDPSRGVIVVRHHERDANRRAGRQIEGPLGSGGLRIVESDATRLKIQTKVGDTYWIDVRHKLR